MTKEFYRFPNGSYYRLDRIVFIGVVCKTYNGYRLCIDVGGNTINNESVDPDILEKARREILAKLNLEYMPIPLWKIRLFRWLIPIALKYHLATPGRTKKDK